MTVIRERQGQSATGERALLMLELATRITRTLDLQEVLDESFAALRQLVEFNGGAIQLIDDNHLVAAATDPPMSPEARTVRIPVGTGVSGTIAATSQPIYIPDITVDERVHPEGRKKGLSGGVRSYFGVPLIMGGFPIGVLQIDSHDVDAFDEDVRTVVLSFVPTIAAAVQNAQLFEQERETLHRLEEAQRLKDSFLAIVSHELRTPLAAAMGFAETLNTRVHQLPPEQAAELAGRIHGATRRLRRLIDDMLFASELETRFLDVSPRPTDLTAVIAAAVSEDVDRKAPVDVVMPAEVPQVMADEPRLHQVLTNLLDNAVKFSPVGERITIRVEVDNDHVDLHVEDRGRGVPPAARDAIFDLFVQAESTDVRSVGGLGIGLHVVRRLCDGMNAPVSVEDRDGGGTRFTVQLQRAR
jgi:signal transduction histidine kinase